MADARAKTDPDFTALTLHSPGGASAQVCPHGAHVLGWRPAGTTRERLFLSTASHYAPGCAIRGGIPVIFPQFSGFGPLPKHGFARNLVWTARPRDGSSRVVFELRDTPATRILWPHAFEALLSIILGDDTLTTTLCVRNTGGTACAFTAALHTYLAVDDIAAVRVRGLQGRPFLDATDAMRAALETRPALRFDGEFDRVFVAAPDSVVLEDGVARVTVERSGFADLVIWNPGATKAAALSDMETDGYRRMLCIEPAVFEPPVRLAPGAEWNGTQVLRYEDVAGAEPASADS